MNLITDAITDSKLSNYYKYSFTGAAFRNVLQNCQCSQRCQQISLENTCARYNVNIKVWLYAFNLHLNSKKAPAQSRFPVGSAEVLRRLFLQNTTGSVLLTLYSTHLNHITTQKGISASYDYFTEKVKQSKKAEQL